MRDSVYKLLSSSSLEDNKLGAELATLQELNSIVDPGKGKGGKDQDSRLYISSGINDLLLLLCVFKKEPIIVKCDFNREKYKAIGYWRRYGPLYIKQQP